MKIQKCTKKVMAKVVIRGEDERRHVVMMFNDNVLKMIEDVDRNGLAMKLLMAELHRFCTGACDVVFSFQEK